MNAAYQAMTSTTQIEKGQRLKSQVREIIASQNLESQRQLINAIAAELNVSVLDCAAAIVHLNDDLSNASVEKAVRESASQTEKVKPISQLGIKLVRFRLDLGTQHQATVDGIKKVLVEESGVDIKNIANVRIMDSYTLIDLPDEMPQEIFHHLKTIEINGQKLDIRRVKPRNKKKRGNRRHRQIQPNPTPSSSEVSH
jgi:DbpA RNA binding domain